MSIKKYNGSSWIDTTINKKYNGSSWVDLSYARKHNGSSWVDMLATDIHLYNKGDEKISITGGWSVIDFWDWYIGGSYAKNSDHLYSEEMTTGYGNKVFRTNKAINLAGYKLNVRYDIYNYLAYSYPNWVWLGISPTAVNYFQVGTNGSNGPEYQLDGKGAVITKEYTSQSGQTLTNQIVTWDISNWGNAYVYISPSSFASNGYMIKMWIHEVWLSKK